jgi:hypothetical protein
MSGRAQRRRAPELAATLFGVAWFLAIGGIHAISPGRFGWIGGPTGDLAQHVQGWLFFRRSPWALPLGRITELLAPAGTTVGFTDANPLLAVVFKLASPLLPLRFQYVGLWLLACFALQGWFGARLAGLACDHPAYRAFGGALFAISPPLTQRLHHDTLCAHGAILALLWLYLRPHPDAAEARRAVLGASAWCWVVALVHPYLGVLCLALTWALIARLRLAGHLERAGAWISAGAAMGGQVSLWAITGYFTAAPAHGPGFGEFSADALTFFNSFGASRFLSALPSGAAQWEGNAYLGLGGIALALAAIFVALLGRASPRGGWRALAPLLVACAALCVVALSSRVTAAGHTVLDLRSLYRPVKGLFGPFRASGRFIWPLYYLVLASGLFALARAFPDRPRVAAIALGAALAVQLADLSPAVGARIVAAPEPRHDPAWRLAAGDFDELLLYPPLIVGVWTRCRGLDYADDHAWVEWGFLAYELSLRFNSGQLARGHAATYDAQCAELEREIAGGHLRRRALYVVRDDVLSRLVGAGHLRPPRRPRGMRRARRGRANARGAGRRSLKRSRSFTCRPGAARTGPRRSAGGVARWRGRAAVPKMPAP